jgi:hypothetical protein
MKPHQEGGGGFFALSAKAAAYHEEKYLCVAVELCLN